MNSTDLSDTQLRNFGLVMAGGLTGMFYIVLPVIFSVRIMLWPAVLAAAVVALSLLAPSLLRIIYRPWMALAHVLGRINTTIILSLVFLLLITPTGIILRLFGVVKDHASDSGRSYRMPSTKRDSRHMENLH